MLYRKLGKSGVVVSVLGFGGMRLPMASTNPAAVFDPETPIQEEEALNMFHYAIEHGVNYFDSAYNYHGGKSELLLGKAVKKCRDNIMLATKLPTWLVKSPSDFHRLLDEQLTKLDTYYLDFYLLHGLGRPSWAKMKELGVMNFLDTIQTDGRVRYVGFSFHDDVRIFKEIIDAYDWTLCQIQYNYFDESFQAGKEGLEYAASKEIGVVIMEPLRGGKLTDRIPSEVQAVWNVADKKRTPAEWALRWVWNHDQVSSVLSGMSSMDQVKENIRIAEDAKPDSLTSGETELIGSVADIYRKMLKVNCTSCAYCMPCPAGVNIPMNFSLYNDTFMFKDAEISVLLYQMLSPKQRASNCTECDECEEKCPQQIKISEELKNVHSHLSS
ncbi:MAG: aldo/keto reductase [Pseudomonadota bacterium]